MRLSGVAAERARERGIAAITLSIAHKKGMSVAVAIGVPATVRAAAAPSG